MNQKIVSLESNFHQTKSSDNLVAYRKPHTSYFEAALPEIGSFLGSATRIQQKEQWDPTPKHEDLYFLRLCTITLLVH